MKKIITWVALAIAGYEIYYHHLSNGRATDKLEEAKDAIGRKASEVKNKISKRINKEVES